MFKSLKNKRAQKKLEELFRYKSMAMALNYQQLALSSDRSGVGNKKSHDIVVSLTSYPARINEVFLTIESLFQQSLRADRVVLWLSEKNFPSLYGDLPEALLNQQERGLEIEFVAEDFGPYKKIIYSLEKYPDSLIVTVDDDILYPVDTIDQLYRSYLKEPNVIHCHRAHRMKLTDNDELLPYSEWDMSVQAEEPSLNIFPTGNGGILYFPGCFDCDVLKRDLFLSLAENADDVWLKAMTLKNNVACKPVNDIRHWKSKLLMIEGSQLDSLTKINKSKSDGNDYKIRAVFDHYKLWSNLKGSHGK